MFVSETKFIVRYAETDQMGVVHHSNYPIWFEAGRTDFIKKMGIPYSKIEETGYMLPLLELKCCYKQPAKYEDEIIVKASLKAISFSRVTFYYEVFKNDSIQAIASGETMHAWTDKQLKPVNIKKHAPELFEVLSKAME